MVNDMCNENEVITSDIYLIAALVTVGFDISLPIDASDPKMQKFIITGVGVENSRSQYYAGNLVGNLKRYANAVRDVKMMVHI